MALSVSSELLENLFFKDAPLHDGAVIIREASIEAAGCFLPLSDNKQIGQELGTRHRAALGISEVSDSITIIISEETGVISMAQDGKLIRYLDTKAIRDILEDIYMINHDTKATWSEFPVEGAWQKMKRFFSALWRMIKSNWVLKIMSILFCNNTLELCNSRE